MKYLPLLVKPLSLWTNTLYLVFPFQATAAFLFIEGDFPLALIFIIYFLLGVIGYLTLAVGYILIFKNKTGYKNCIASIKANTFSVLRWARGIWANEHQREFLFFCLGCTIVSIYSHELYVGLFFSLCIVWSLTIRHLIKFYH